MARHRDIFAWTYRDIPDIDPEVMVHKLNVNRTTKPVWQKRRNFTVDQNLTVTEEVDKLLDTNFIWEVHYLEWLSNVVLVTKVNEKWRVCVDFMDLNKVCPKNNFPLPRIDTLVNSTIKHELLSFMDAFSGYNQIRMYGLDQKRTSFIID